MHKKSAVFGLMFVLALPFTSWAENEFVGEWAVKHQIEGQEWASTLSIGEDNGSWTSEHGSGKVSNIKTADGKLTFVCLVDREGQEFSLDCEAVIADEKLVGKMITSQGSLEFTGTRIPSAPSFLGEWDIEMNYQGRKIQARMNIAETDSGLSGNWSSERGESTLDKVAINDNVLTFNRTFEREGQEILIDCEARIIDGKLNGKLVSPMGELPFSGTAVAKQVEDSEATKLVKSMDANGDGKVTEDETTGGIKDYFSRIDADGNGSIDEVEMQAVVEYRRQQGQ